MSSQHPDIPYSLPAAADLSGSQYCGVIINTSGLIALPALGGRVDGILDNPDATSGAQARFWPVGTPGFLKGKAGGNITAGALLSVTAAGKFVVSVTQGHKCVAKALDAAANNDVFRFQFLPDLPDVP